MANGMAGRDHLEGRLEERFAHAGERPTRGDDVVDVEEVARRDANVLVLAHPHQLCPAPRLVVVPVQPFAGLGHQDVAGGGGEGRVVADGRR